MQLEQIESECLRLLGASPQPLVPLHGLMLELRKAFPNADLREDLILQFLRSHQDVVVLEGLGNLGPVTEQDFAEAGYYMGPRVVLRSRVPGPRDLSAHLLEQMNVLETLLAKALDAAREQKAPKRIEAVEQAMIRLGELRARLQRHMGTTS
ncbi:MAG TPA: hypothetical protein PK379_01775 [Candidatus Hydrogenedentes bacterium]|nr:hypothetical protein [Candidatus Hydrogenedentota bacterium]HOJ67874.1 hypothetical protein [Candidatus Hydrogenedentota bacterium]HOK88732.1 hypothetical protein [Candidatus Hydrogenedentota bacterium]